MGSAALSCQGSTTSNGAMNLTSLATLLNGCEDKVKMACATENMPLPNMTEVSTWQVQKSLLTGHWPPSRRILKLPPEARQLTVKSAQQQRQPQAAQHQHRRPGGTSWPGIS